MKNLESDIDFWVFEYEDPEGRYDVFGIYKQYPTQQQIEDELLRIYPNDISNGQWRQQVLTGLLDKGEAHYYNIRGGKFK